MKLNLIKNKNIKILIYFLLVAIIFSLTYRQAPLYQSNQHTKFLHGLAKAGYGNLKNDWLAETIDPLPVFSFIVFFTGKFLNEYFFYFFYVIILGLFIFIISGISNNIFFTDDNDLKKILFFSIIITLHSTLLDSFFFRIFKYRITELLMEKGVAEQYLLGSYFQPCVFGVFLLLSILFFLKEKPFLSIIFLIIPSVIHSAYLFSSAILTLTYMIIIYKDEKKIKKIILLGGFSFILVLPILIYNLIYLGPTSPEITKKALYIIVNARIPQHTDLAKWLNINAFLKLLIVIILIIIVRKKKIFLILLIPCLAAVFFTIIQLFIKNDLIAFIAPWRISVWLVPLSTSIIVGYLIDLAFKKLSVLNFNLIKKFLLTFCGIIISVHIIYGLYGTIKQFDEYLNKDHGSMMNYVKKNLNQNDQYLIPPEMMDFRLNTGSSVFVTYKSHPYKDVELIEWNDRVEIAQEFYNNMDNENICKMLNLFKEKFKINKVVILKNQFDLKLKCWHELYSDSKYCIYKIN